MTTPVTQRVAQPDPTRISNFCRTHSIRRLGLFGSVPRGNFRQDSDLDVLVEFTPGFTPGLGFWDIEDELTRILGRRVDLHTAPGLSPYFRAVILEEAEWIYG